MEFYHSIGPIILDLSPIIRNSQKKITYVNFIPSFVYKELCISANVSFLADCGLSFILNNGLWNVGLLCGHIFWYILGIGLQWSYLDFCVVLTWCDLRGVGGSTHP